MNTSCIPLTRTHLLAACDWAEQDIAHQKADAYSHGREYKQSNWDCGTACCLHGYAHLLATGQPTNVGPSKENYADVHALAKTLLRDGRTTPAQVRAALMLDTDFEAAKLALHAAGIKVVTGSATITEGIAVILEGSPDISVSGGEVLTYGTSAPVITKIKA